MLFDRISSFIRPKLPLTAPYTEGDPSVTFAIYEECLQACNLEPSAHPYIYRLTSDYKHYRRGAFVVWPMFGCADTYYIERVTPSLADRLTVWNAPKLWEGE